LSSGPFPPASLGPLEKSREFPERVAWAVVGLALILLCLIFASAYRTIVALVTSEKQVAHSHSVQAALQDFRADILTAQSARRAYTITGEATQLGPIRPLLEIIPSELRNLRKLTADNPAQQRSLDRLEPLVQRELTLIRQSIGNEPAKPGMEGQIGLTEAGTQLMGQIVAILAQMDGEEGRQLLQQQNRSGATYSRTLLLLTTAFVIAVLVLAVSFNALLKELRRRRVAEQSARSQEHVLNAFFASSPVGLAIVDSDLRFQKVNTFLADMNHLAVAQHAERKINEVWGELGFTIEPPCRQVLATGQPVLNQELSRTSTDDSSRGEWIVNYFPLYREQGQCNQVGMVVLDVTLLRRAEDAARRLSSRLLHMQDIERRRMARELHDSLGQYLTALSIFIERLSCEKEPMDSSEDRVSLWAETRELLQKALAETRTISHLLHPPLLDEAGLASATRWYVEGFGNRSGIRVNLEIPPDLGRFPEGVELALFRALQECLTNVHRHSGSGMVDVRIKRPINAVGLEVQDYGEGIPDALLAHLRVSGSEGGVGLAGMHERVHELGGTVEIDSSPSGTCVTIRIPLGEPATAGYAVQSASDKAPAA